MLRNILAILPSTTECAERHFNVSFPCIMVCFNSILPANDCMCFVVNIAAFTLENRELTKFLKNLDPNDIFDNNIVDVVIRNIFPLVLAVPVRPRGVSGISICLFQN